MGGHLGGVDNERKGERISAFLNTGTINDSSSITAQDESSVNKTNSGKREPYFFEEMGRGISPHDGNKAGKCVRLRNTQTRKEET